MEKKIPVLVPLRPDKAILIPSPLQGIPPRTAVFEITLQKPFHETTHIIVHALSSKLYSLIRLPCCEALVQWVMSKWWLNSEFLWMRARKYQPQRQQEVFFSAVIEKAEELQKNQVRCVQLDLNWPLWVLAFLGQAKGRTSSCFFKLEKLQWISSL